MNPAPISKKKKKQAKKYPTLNMASVWLMFMYFAGMVVAQGWWKLLAIFFPPYAIYAIVEKIMRHFGIV
jgi:hypothetical protein